ncbi:MAG: hypothetical protein U9Q58_01030 [Pseudomonadota bacterium]|nr:hypothetical protein [Pseudomonadota bacterium]
MSHYHPPALKQPRHAKFFFTNLTTLLLLFLMFATSALADQVKLAWAPNPESNLAGYKLYYKAGSPGTPYEGSGLDQGDSHIVIPLGNLTDQNNPEFTLSGLPAGEIFYFVATAYSSDGDEGPLSNELSYQATVPVAPPVVPPVAPTETFTISALPQDGGTISPSGNTDLIAGSSQTYTAVAADNYHLVDLLVDGISVGTLNSFTFTSLDSNHTITAIFTLDNHTITASAGTNGVINPSGSIAVEHGAEQIFTFTPDAHYHIETVLVNNQVVDTFTSYQFTDLAENATISASFAIDTYAVEAWAGDAGSIYPAGSIVADYDETIYFEIMPDNGMQIKDVIVDGSSMGPISEYYFNNIDTTHTIEASFEPIPEKPLANAGPDQNVEEATETILDGNNSIDLNYEIVSYHWEQTGGTPVAITAPDNVTSGFVTPMPGSEGESLEFCLTVTNSAGMQTSDYCIVNVVLDNSPPEADAGYEQTVAEGTLVQLNGTDSFDPDDGIGHYQWLQVAGNQVELSNYTAASPTFMAPTIDSPEGTSLIFLLTVTDSGGLKARDRCIVNVSWNNEPPVADAGFNQMVSSDGTVLLDGTGSYDNDDGISVYHWTQTQGVPVTLSDPTAMQPYFTAPEAGLTEALLTFRLTVSDSNGLQSQAECLVEIMPEPEPEPTDTTAPYLTILSPSVTGTYTTKSSSTSVSGEASDNVEVAVVSWSNNLGGSGTAYGTEQWTISRLRLKKGYNTITITATDTAGNNASNEIVIYRQ